MGPHDLHPSPCPWLETGPSQTCCICSVRWAQPKGNPCQGRNLGKNVACPLFVPRNPRAMCHQLTHLPAIPWSCGPHGDP